MPLPKTAHFHRLLLVLGVATPALLAQAQPALAADPDPALLKYVGAYKYGGTKEEYFAITDKATEDGLAQLNVVMRMMAKKAIESAPKVFIDSIAIDLESNKIGIKAGEAKHIATEPGKTETIKSSDGKRTAKVTHQFDGAKIVQTITHEGGSNIWTFQLDADGKTLTVDANLKISMLEKPVKFKLKYVRK